MLPGDEFANLPPLRPLSRVKARLVRAALESEAEEPGAILYQHTVFCQTALPYRDPGAAVRVWQRQQGRVSLLIEAGRALHPENGRWVELGLPYSPKPRLILAHLNREALRTGSPEVEVEKSLTAFVKRLLDYEPNGAEIRLLKEQLARLAACSMRFGLLEEGYTLTMRTDVITAFDLWFPKDEQQRVLWPQRVRLGQAYFDSLQHHAVPLDERAIGALAHSAMALDVYAWLAQRLHRIAPGKPQPITWKALKEQFGQGYGRMDNFKRVFRQTLTLVLGQYGGARIELDGRTLTLHHSSPPVLCRRSPAITGPRPST